MPQLVLNHYRQPAARRHLWIGIAMLFIVLAFLAEQSAAWLAARPAAVQGLLASLLAGLATGLGALPVLAMRRPEARLMSPLLGFAGGMMLAASLLSLLWPALTLAGAAAAPWLAATLLASAAGAWAMQCLDTRLPHQHVETAGSVPQGTLQLALVVAAIALHNIPEGLAVGVAAAAGEDHGLSLGIAVQNVPEGWIVASALLAMGVAPWRAAGWALATGLVEPLGGLFGVLASSVADAALPLALAAAAGAMLWVVFHEVMPAAFAPGRRGGAWAGVALGSLLMTSLSLLG